MHQSMLPRPPYSLQLVDTCHLRFPPVPGFQVTRSDQSETRSLGRAE